MISLELKNVDFHYEKSSKIFSNLQLLVRLQSSKGKLVALMGLSGSGKSTLLKLFAKTLTPVKGKVEYKPTEINIGFLPQEPVLFLHLSVKKNIEYFKYSSNHKTSYSQEIVDELVKKLDMHHLMDRVDINDLSGGQKQRVMLIRALSIKPNVMLLDEPASTLDCNLRRDFLLLMKKNIIEHNILAIYVSHDFTDISLVADEIIFIPSVVGSNTYHSTIENFTMKAPDFISASNISYPYNNWLNVSIEDNLVSVIDGSLFDYKLQLTDKNIFFGKDGTHFIVERINNTHVILRIGEQEICIKESIIRNQSIQKIYFNGHYRLYNMDGGYEKTVFIESNKIVEN